MTDEPRLYTRRFFQLFAAVILHMTGVAMQFHFGKYTAALGHDEDTLGWVMGIGMVGTLLARPRIGGWVDQLGTRPVLLAGTFIAGLAAVGYRLTANLVALAALRIAATLANAMFFTAVAAYTAHVAPARRRAESLGTIGMAGFMGMILGPAIGDWIFAHPSGEVSPFTWFFLTAASAHWAAAGMLITLEQPPFEALTAQGAKGAPREPFFRTLRTYWPGVILLVGATFTLAQTIPFLFLERFAQSRDILNIRNFYFGYAPTAIALRIIGRRVPERFGRRRTLVMGLLLLSGGLLLLHRVQSEPQLLLPAIVMGAGHCFIYPSLIDLAAGKLPPSQRGLGTSIILGAGDLGSLAGFIFCGHLITAAGFVFTFRAVAAWTLLTLAVFAWRERRALFHLGATATARTP